MNQYEQELGIPAAEVHTVQMPNLALRTEAVLAGKDIQAAILPPAGSLCRPAGSPRRHRRYETPKELFPVRRRPDSGHD